MDQYYKHMSFKCSMPLSLTESTIISSKTFFYISAYLQRKFPFLEANKEKLPAHNDCSSTMMQLHQYKHITTISINNLMNAEECHTLKSVFESVLSHQNVFEERRIFVIKISGFLKHSINLVIKDIIDKYSSDCCFLILAQSYSNLSPAIHSRCLHIHLQIDLIKSLENLVNNPDVGLKDASVNECTNLLNDMNLVSEKGIHNSSSIESLESLVLASNDDFRNAIILYNRHQCNCKCGKPCTFVYESCDSLKNLLQRFFNNKLPLRDTCLKLSASGVPILYLCKTILSMITALESDMKKIEHQSQIVNKDFFALEYYLEEIQNTFEFVST